MFLICVRSKKWSGKLGEDRRHKLGNGSFGVALLLLLRKGQGSLQTCRAGLGGQLAGLRVI